MLSSIAKDWPYSRILPPVLWHHLLLLLLCYFLLLFAKPSVFSALFCRPFSSFSLLVFAVLSSGGDVLQSSARAVAECVNVVTTAVVLRTLPFPLLSCYLCMILTPLLALQLMMMITAPSTSTRPPSECAHKSPSRSQFLNLRTKR